MTLIKRKSMMALSAAALVLAGCASGVPVSESPIPKAEIPDGKARIVVYRTGLFGAAIQPTVRVSGRETGKCAPQGAFYVTTDPGQHTVSARTEVEKTSYLSVHEGETAYVKCSIGFGLLVGQPKLDIVPAAIGEADTQKLKVTGQY